MEIDPIAGYLVEGYNVPSGVGCQPMSDREAILGAQTRARSALECDGLAEFGVGIEGTLSQVGSLWFNCGWICVAHREPDEHVGLTFGYGTTIRMPIPPKFISMIHSGEHAELGDVLDAVFDGENLKQKEGHFGLFTKSITRTTGYRDGVISALSRFGPQAHLWDGA